MNAIPSFRAPEAFDQAKNLLSDYLREQVSQGVTFKPGQFIQLGWSWLEVAEKDGQTILCAPQWGKHPMHFQEDCSEALNVVLLQRYFAESFTPQITPCHARQSALMIKDLDQCKNIFINRDEPTNERDSGWFFGAQDSQLEANDSQNLVPISLWELVCRYPASVECLWLPAGWQVVFEDRPIVLQDYEPAGFAQDSYYHQQHHKQA